MMLSVDVQMLIAHPSRPIWNRALFVSRRALSRAGISFPSQYCGHYPR